MNLVLFLVVTAGKIKPNLVLAYDRDHAIRLVNERYPRFIGSEKKVRALDRPGLVD